MSEDGSYQDPDITSVIDNAARFISKKGLEFEKTILAMHNNHRFSFLRSSYPLHGIYKQKLTEYQHGAHDDDYDHYDDDDDDDVANTSGEIIEPPPGVIKTLLEGTASYVSKYGLEEEKSIKASNANQERYNFMKRSDPFHAFYQHKLTEYRSQNPQGDAIASNSNDEAEAGDFQNPTYLNLPNLLLFRLPTGMSLDEFDTIKRTSQFVGWYGGEFLVGLLRRAIPQLEFMKPTHISFKCFSEFVLAYSKVLKPPTDLQQELRKNAAYLATILDHFLLRLQWDPSQNQLWHEGGEKAMIDWHASVSKDFANKDQDKQPPLLGSSSSEPHPKRQKFDDSALVPQDQQTNTSDQVEKPGLSRTTML